MKDLQLFFSRHNKTEPCMAIGHKKISYYELTAVLHGEIVYEVDGEVVELKPGDAVFIRPDSVRSRPMRTDVDYISFNFRTEDEISLPTFIEGALGGEARMLIEVYDRTSEELYGKNSEINTHLLACLIAILEEKVAREGLSRLTQQIASYINANFSRRITLSDIGRLTFFSPIYCDTVFKRETGRSIIDYLIERRLDEAKKHLSGTVPTLSEVSEMCGFSDYNYFCRIFKKREGITPGAYRRMMTL